MKARSWVVAISICWLLGWALLPQVQAVPGQVILIRHAEKPLDRDDAHLDDRGRARAAALPNWFLTNPLVAQSGKPSVLLATRITRHDRSRRTFETLEPLARQLNLSIETPYPAGDYRALARRLLTSHEYDGKTVVICWTHEYLPALAKELGVKPEPPPWKGHVFDRAWLIHWTKKKAKLVDIPQHLLPGDSDN